MASSKSFPVPVTRAASRGPALCTSDISRKGFDKSCAFQVVEKNRLKISVRGQLVTFRSESINGVLDHLDTDIIRGAFAKTATSADQRNDVCDENSACLWVVLKSPTQYAPHALRLPNNLPLCFWITSCESRTIDLKLEVGVAWLSPFGLCIVNETSYRDDNGVRKRRGNHFSSD